MANKNIVILDDHKLFRDSLYALLTEYYSSININHFSRPEPALEYIENCKKENHPIDLIITDQNHPGQNGFEFSATCRKLENKYNRGHGPLLLLSMTVNDSDQPGIIMNKNISPENPINLHLPKSMGKENLINCIRTLIGHTM